MEKSNHGCSNSTDKEMMNYLLRYVIGKPFPRKHTVVMEADDDDDGYGIRMLTPSQIFESTEGTKKNTRYLVTFQNREKAKKFSSKGVPGIWKPTGKAKLIFDGKKRHMGYVKISWYYYYDRDKSSLRKSEWHIREYYLTDRYLPQNKVERKDVLFTMMINTKMEQKGTNDNQGISDQIQIIQSPQLDHHNDVASSQGISDDKTHKQIIQSLQGLQLQDSH